MASRLLTADEFLREMKRTTAEYNSKRHYPDLDMGQCCECGFVAKVAEFMESDEGNYYDGPEIVHYCPRCDDGFVENYFPSEESLKEWKKYVSENLLKGETDEGRTD